MNATLERVAQFLDKENVLYHGAPNGQAIGAHLALTNLGVALVFETDTDNTVFTLTAQVPVIIPADRRAAVAEFLMRVNSNLRLGRFVLEYEPGGVFLRLDRETASVEPTDELLGRWLVLACATVDGFFPALMSVTFARMNPSQAVEQGEAAYAALFGKQPSNGDERN